jgi:hypothetical protein
VCWGGTLQGAVLQKWGRWAFLVVVSDFSFPECPVGGKAPRLPHSENLSQPGGDRHLLAMGLLCQA